MDEPDLLRYFAEFNPSPPQLKQLSQLVKGVCQSQTTGYGAAAITAAIIFAPDTLRKLTPGAVDLLKRCRARQRAFHVHLDWPYDPFHEHTYAQLFDLLLSEGLITDTSAISKLSGAYTVPQLRARLGAAGLSTQGNKADLVGRLVGTYSKQELDSLVRDVLLYRSTLAGDHALVLLGQLQSQMLVALGNALAATASYYERLRPTPLPLPSGVLFDDGEVLITEDDVYAAMDEFTRLTQDAHVGSLASEVMLSPAAVESILAQTLSITGGFFIILASQEETAPFVQGAYLKCGAEITWRLEASGDASGLSVLGFQRLPGEILRGKEVPQSQAVDTVLDAVRVAFGARCDDTVWISVDG